MQRGDEIESTDSTDSRNRKDQAYDTPSLSGNLWIFGADPYLRMFCLLILLVTILSYFSFSAFWSIYMSWLLLRWSVSSLMIWYFDGIALW